MGNNHLVTAVAEEVRDWAEAQAEGTYKEGDLNGMCAIASAELFKRLTKKGFKPELHLWICREDGESAHVFVVVDDHVVDVTATQFGKMRNIPVYIEHLRMAEACYDWYQSAEVFTTVEALVANQIKHQWPADQLARKDRK